MGWFGAAKVDHRGRNPARTGAAGGGRVGERRGRGRRVRDSRPDSAGGEGERDAAERLTASAGPGDAGIRPAERYRGGEGARTRPSATGLPGSIPRPGRTRRLRQRGRWRRLVPRKRRTAAIRRRRRPHLGGRPGSLRSSRSGKNGAGEREKVGRCGRRRRGGRLRPPERGGATAAWQLGRQLSMAPVP